MYLSVAWLERGQKYRGEGKGPGLFNSFDWKYIGGTESYLVSDCSALKGKGHHFVSQVRA